MDLKLSHCLISVAHHDNALAVYCAVLGLQVRNDVKFEGMRWVTVGREAQPEVTMVLEPPGMDPNASPTDRQIIAELMTKGMLRAVVFETDDCDALYERVSASGAEVLQEPMDQPYGVR